MTASHHDENLPARWLDTPAVPPRTPGTLATPAQLAEQHQRFLAAATADNTRRTYRSAIRHFLAWGGVLPCDEAALIRYLLAFAEVLNPRTLALRLTALSQWHRYQGFPDPGASATVRKTLRGIERVHGRPRQKAKALLLEDLERIVAHLDTLEGLTALRDSALLQVGYFGAFRRSELVMLEVQYLQWEREGLRITLPRSKTDQEGEGLDKAIPFGDSICCPAKALRGWLDTAQIEQGPLFRRISRWGVLGEVGLHEGSVNAILSARAEAAGLSYVPEMSSHSLRRGLATSAHRAGAGFLEIKRQGGWRHDGTVHGYIEEARAFEENAAGSLLRRKP
ncbi:MULTISPECIES: site-specific integrase [unclassified Pseudomonas]|uniref:site-specific integrase n=1 Tax=unclassified Pseudomonas TaxID=196821 RepID=UPI002AB410B0|nr:MULTISPECIES: site-specific integrase [unclassified Pseudomonas]MDY7560445.1 site-specific integrase [Pseudomonas sp. AB6]MEA9975959.1 site-specific integrase [Pseudomonas sp. RTS4]MEA9993202.1 site-specific integrase [Pseudomonas sp. AA4]MEB0043107.1 site-specific integrase [Pseudomonas sp. MH10]MEB0077722.1 site-specific integrase [Pseudomonas sp. MH10out]